MEQWNKSSRGPKSSGADGGDLLMTQAQLWIDLGAALAGVLRRMRRGGEALPSAEAGADDATADGEAGRRNSSEQEAA